ncbi:MAG: hypothetical protein Q9164_005591 [Protoblastenia rupestris]
MEWQWLSYIPSATAPGLAVFVFQDGSIAPNNFSWSIVAQRGKEFLTALTELVLNESLQHCPVLLASHSVGGLVIKEALWQAYQDLFKFRGLLQALTGVMLLVTPHPKSEHTKSWPNTALLLQMGILSKKKDSVDQENVERFAKFSLEFERANVLTPAIFWIFADAAAKITESFSRIALRLGLVTANSVDARDPVVTRELVKGWLANPLKTADPTNDQATDYASWLLVFDNADYPEELEEY